MSSHKALTGFIPRWRCPRFDARVVCCIPTYKRTWQIVQTLPINLVLAWPFRDTVWFVVADLNDDEEKPMRSLMHTCQAALRGGHLHYYRRQSPRADVDGWRGWHASIGKNAAAACAQDLDAGPDRQKILVNLDNDNFVSAKFFENIFRKAPNLLAPPGRRIGKGPAPLSVVRWRHPAQPATNGRSQSPP